MPGGTGASGFLGIAFETTLGTPVTPTRFFPIKSETLTNEFAHSQRRLLRGTADNLGKVLGFNHVTGTITAELLPNVLPFFLYCSRNTVAKTGAGPYKYTTTPAHFGDAAGLPVGKKALTITVLRNGVSMAFSGCVVTGIEITVEEGVPYMAIEVIGKAEATAATPTYTHVATDVPLSPATWSIQVPTATALNDVESLTFRMTDNGEPQFRLSSETAAKWVKFGEREVMLELTKDFTARTELDAFKALTATTVTVDMRASVGYGVTILLSNAQRETYEPEGLSDQSSPILASVSYEGCYDTATSKSYEFVVDCAENIT